MGYSIYLLILGAKLVFFFQLSVTLQRVLNVFKLLRL